MIGDINKLGRKDSVALVTDVFVAEAKITPIAVFINIKLYWLHNALMS